MCDSATRNDVAKMMEPAAYIFIGCHFEEAALFVDGVCLSPSYRESDGKYLDGWGVLRINGQCWTFAALRKATEPKCLSVSVLQSLLEQVREEMRVSLKPLGVWDPASFGVWTIPFTPMGVKA